MSDEEKPKFIKPGDDPVLDGMLDELRFDSGLYHRGEYDIFGRRRGLDKAGEEGPGAGDGDAAPPAAAAPVVAPATRGTARRRVKAWVAVGAVAAAIAPVAIYAAVWKPPSGTEPVATAMVIA